jgi:hypothetical protein
MLGSPACTIPCAPLFPSSMSPPYVLSQSLCASGLAPDVRAPFFVRLFLFRASWTPPWRIVARGAASSVTCPPPAVISLLARRHAAHPHSPHRVAGPPSAPSDRFRRSHVCSCVTPIVSPFLRPMMTPTHLLCVCTSSQVGFVVVLFSDTCTFVMYPRPRFIPLCYSVRGVLEFCTEVCFRARVCVLIWGASGMRGYTRSSALNTAYISASMTSHVAAGLPTRCRTPSSRLGALSRPSRTRA